MQTEDSFGYHTLCKYGNKKAFLFCHRHAKLGIRRQPSRLCSQSSTVLSVCSYTSIDLSARDIGGLLAVSYQGFPALLALPSETKLDYHLSLTEDPHQRQHRLVLIANLSELGGNQKHSHQGHQEIWRHSKTLFAFPPVRLQRKIKASVQKCKQ